MKVAVICEFSGTVRDAFTRMGHDATSFDLLPSETEGKHVMGDVRQLDMDYWKQFDLAICHPPCTHLAVSGARWFKDKLTEQAEALDFVRWLMELPIDRIAIENPISIISSRIRKPDQIIQPWQFGHGETKATCLWLKNLPKLEPTNIVEGREAKVHKMPPSENRWKERSRTYKGIAEAMAKQWGSIEKLKAFHVYDREADCEEAYHEIVFAESELKAKFASLAYSNNVPWEDIEAKRKPWFDQYGETRSIPISAYLADGWVFECDRCNSLSAKIEAGNKVICECCFDEFQTVSP